MESDRGQRHITDASNASRTLLFNIHTGQWDEELLGLFRVPAAVLPEVRASSEIYGEITTSLGLEGVPLGGIAGDQQAALFGQMCVAPGLTKNTYGTGCFMLQNTGVNPVASRHRLLTTVAWRLNGRTEYALEGSVFIGGAVVQWMRDGLGLIRSGGQISRPWRRRAGQWRRVFGAGVCGFGSAALGPYARGVSVGLTRDTTARHIARAVLESIAFQVADLQGAMQTDAGVAVKELRVDGGAACNDLLMQFQADLLGAPVVRRRDGIDGIGRGVSGRVGGGYWKNTQEIAAHWQVERRFEPKMDHAKVRALRRRWQQAVERVEGMGRGGQELSEDESDVASPLWGFLCYGCCCVHAGAETNWPSFRGTSSARGRRGVCHAHFLGRGGRDERAMENAHPRVGTFGPGDLGEQNFSHYRGERGGRHQLEGRLVWRHRRRE